MRTKEKLAAVGGDGGQLAHEIRNPLGAISGSAQVLMGEAGISSEHERLLAIIRRESHRLSDALNQFLHQARPSPPAPGPVDLRPVLDEAVTLLRNAPEVGPAHRVEFEAEEGPLLCRADPDRITQVFWNSPAFDAGLTKGMTLLAVNDIAYKAERDGKPFVIEGTMADFLDDSDPTDREVMSRLVSVIEFEDAAERQAYIAREMGFGTDLEGRTWPPSERRAEPGAAPDPGRM